MGEVRTLLAVVCIGALAASCAPHALDPVERPPLSLSDTSKCYGLGTKMSYFAERFDYNKSLTFGGGKSPDEYRFPWALGFLESAQPGGQTPSFALLSFDAKTSIARLSLLSANGSILRERAFGDAAVLECGPGRTIIAIPTNVCPGRMGCNVGNRRATVIMSPADGLIRVDSKLEVESNYVVFRDSETRTSWAMFRPAR